MLFIGEAPGESEDAIGRPFVGDAGRQLDVMVFQAYGMLTDHTIECSKSGVVGNARGHITYGITNILACIPRNVVEYGTGEIRTPHKEEAAACQPRLSEICQLANPKLICLLGDIAKRFFRPLIKTKPTHPLPLLAKVIELVHPARILRLQDESPSAASLAEKKFVLALSAALKGLSNAPSYQ